MRLRDHPVLLDLAGLMLSAVLVHLCYVLYIDPAAAELVTLAAAANDVPPRTLAIVLKDFEQEVCLVLAGWCAWLFCFRYTVFQDQGALLEVDFLSLGQIESGGVETIDALLLRIRRTAREAAGGGQLLASLEAALDTLRESTDFGEATQAGVEACELHLEVLNSRLGITRYILWAIPSVGFLGTVRGIGEALGRAGEAMAGDISGVANSLSIAFNSTFVALALSLVLMFVSHVLQGREERLVADYKHYIAARLMATLRRKSSGSAPQSDSDPDPAPDQAHLAKA